ncbi:hypothetical protein, partial, partial [Absidia glauca]
MAITRQDAAAKESTPPPVPPPVDNPPVDNTPVTPADTTSVSLDTPTPQEAASNEAPIIEKDGDVKMGSTYSKYAKPDIKSQLLKYKKEAFEKTVLFVAMDVNDTGYDQAKEQLDRLNGKISTIQKSIEWQDKQTGKAFKDST